MRHYKYPAMQRYDESNPPLTIRLDKKLFERFEQYCIRIKQSKKAVATEALKEYLDKKENMVIEESKKKEILGLFK